MTYEESLDAFGKMFIEWLPHSKTSNLQWSFDEFMKFIEPINFHNVSETEIKDIYWAAA